MSSTDEKISIRHIVSPLVEVISNKRELACFKYGSSTRPNMWSSFIPKITVEYFVTCLRPVQQQHPLGWYSQIERHRLIIRQRRMAFGAHATMILDLTNVDRPRLLTNRMYEFWSNLRGTSAFNRPEEVLSQVITAQLLSKGLVPVHCACVERNGEGILIIAPPNTGKTLTTLKLVKGYSYCLVAEDIAIFDGTTMFGCPYTTTGLPEAKARNGSREKKGLMRILFPYRAKQGISNQLDEDKITGIVKVSSICFLKRGRDEMVRRISRDAAKKTLLKNNLLEFDYRTNSELLESWYRYDYPDLGSLPEREMRLLSTLVDSVDEIVEITCMEAPSFAEVIVHK